MSYGLIEQLCAALRTGVVSEKAFNAIRKGGLLAQVAEMFEDNVVTTGDLEVLIASKSKPSAPTQVERWHTLGPTAIGVNLDAPDELPFDGAKRDWAPSAKSRGYVRVERVGEDLLVGGKRTLLHLDDGQKDGRSLTGHSLQPRLQSLATLDPRILDVLFENQHLIPESWKMDENGRTRFIFFWGAGYRDSEGSLYVRDLYWSGGAWNRGCRWLDYRWFGRYSAAVSAS
jgi:hypothetical protein